MKKLLVLLALLVPGCDIDTAPDGDRLTPAGNGPIVVFDTARRPLPEIPTPNDVATFADPTSRTGRRVNVSLVASTRLESVARAGFDSLEGWGTFAPITVAFGSPLDLDDVAARTTKDYDPTDDPFYVVDLATGVPVALDMGKGNFPLAVADPSSYWPNDPRASSDTLLFETVEEGAGQTTYQPALDTDFDGVLDHPNVLHPNGGNARIEDVIPWYERESDTLILRPVVPLEESHEYAVVLTDRLHGANGPVRSPFEYVHHASQRAGADRVSAILSDPMRRAYYGDLAGTGLAHVSFVWTFTTQPVRQDMQLLADGLHGNGPFSHLATDFPPVATAGLAVGTAIDPSEEPPGAIDVTPACASGKATPYIVHVDSAKDTIRQLLQQALGLAGQQLDRLMQSLESVDHFVIGSYESPYFLGDPKHEDPDGKFELDFQKGTGRINRDTVQFWISVPKATATAKQPFPTTVWAHGTTLHADEIILRAGYWAKQGLAMMGINMPGHGLYLNPGFETLAEAFLSQACLSPWITSIGAGRETDLNGDGVPDSGGLLWSAHIFHSRDNIRQSVVDEMQATRVLRGFDGVMRSTQDYNRDGKPDLAGDFDGDGVPDLGGPNVTLTSSGDSFGGVLAMVHGAVDPNITATAPISGGGGLTDVATRSALVPDSVLEQIFSPLVVSVPASERPPVANVPQTACAADQRSVRFVVNDLTDSREIEIACLSAAELDIGKTVVLENVRNGEKRCARTAANGNFRLPIPADVNDLLDIQIYDAPDVVVSYKGCDLAGSPPVGRRIKTFEQATTTPTDVADPTKTCDDPGGCAQFRDQFYPVTSPLVAPQEGLGLSRQTPEARRLLGLVQAGIDAGDPVNFARSFAERQTAVTAWITAGDPNVPAATGYAFARAAGAIPFLPPGDATVRPEWAAYATPQALFDSLGGKTPNQVLIDTFAIEGLARLNRTSAGPTCTPNYVSSATCTMPPSSSACRNAIADADWAAEGANLWGAPHPSPPLRLARLASGDWAPRLTGVMSGPLLGVVDAWIDPGGTHVFVNGDPCKAFDDVVYHDNLLARFLATNGTDLYLLSHPQTHHCLASETCPF